MPHISMLAEHNVGRRFFELLDQFPGDPQAPADRIG
jgi:hypothetical protein